jgi:hypothetical protein
LSREKTGVHFSCACSLELADIGRDGLDLPSVRSWAICGDTALSKACAAGAQQKIANTAVARTDRRLIIRPPVDSPVTTGRVERADPVYLFWANLIQVNDLSLDRRFSARSGVVDGAIESSGTQVSADAI